MFPSQNAKGNVYNVFHVIGAIQNMDSDFETDSEDTDISDEEECEIACEPEKENKNPLLAQNQWRRFNDVTKLPKDMLKLKALHFGCLQQIHGRCGYVGLICSKICLL